MRRLERRPISVSPSATELLGAARKGDEAAWEQIIDRYQSLINSISRRHRLASDDAYDVSQYVWMQLVSHIDNLRDTRALPGWISATTTHRCYEILRTCKRSVSVDPLATGLFDLINITAKTEGEGRHEVDDDLLRAEQRRAVREGLSELTQTQQDLLLLLVADPPVPYSEISRRMNLPIGSIGPTRARLLKKLRKSMAVQQLVEDPQGNVLVAA
jgi:RNA polymerase sigma factor (sigma-70 family)